MTPTTTLWEPLSKVLSQVPYSAAAEHLIYHYLSRQLPGGPSLVNVALRGDTLVLDERSLALNAAPKLQRVFRALLARPQGRVDRVTLIREVYLDSPALSISERQMNCYRHNIIKLMSRARRLLYEAYPAKQGLIFEWLPYDTQLQTWQLYRLREYSMAS